MAKNAKEIKLYPHGGSNKFDTLTIKSTRPYLYFYPLIDGSGNEFRISKQLLKQLLGVE